MGSRSLGVEFLTLVYYSYEFSYELLLLLAAVELLDCFYLGERLLPLAILSLLLLRKLSKRSDLGTREEAPWDSSLVEGWCLKFKSWMLSVSGN
jgi:hypothetical protein